MSLLDSSIAALQNAMSSIDTSAQDWSANWETAKNNLIAKAGEFSSLYNKLQRQAGTALADPSLSSDYQALMTKGNYIRSTVQQITASFDTASDWFNNTLATIKNAVGLGAIPLPINYAELARRTGMGFVQIISVVAIAAAASAIVYWLQDAYVMSRKLDLAEKVRATGGDPERILNAGTFTGALGNVKTIAWLAAGGMLLYFAWPYVKKAIK